MINNFMLFSAVLTFLGCVQLPTVYYVDEGYSGPCIIFIKTGEVDSVKVINGLGVVSSESLSSNFVFKSMGTRKELEIVPIGKEALYKDEGRRIYQLVKGKVQTRCSKKMIENIFFFVGSKTEFDKWSSKYTDPFDHFDTFNVDWCGYYKKHAISSK